MIYDIKSGIVEDSIDIASHRVKESLNVYVFNHPKYEEYNFAINRAKLIVIFRNDIGRYQIFHNEPHYNVPANVIKNRHNHILACYQVRDGIKIRDAFDSSNETVIPYSCSSFPENYSVYFNDSGEEIYICENGALKIYVYK